MCVSIQEEKYGHHKQYAQGRIITKSKIECGGVNTPLLEVLIFPDHYKTFIRFNPK